MALQLTKEPIAQAILIHVEIFKQDPPDLEELKELARTAEIPVIDIMTLNCSQIDPEFFIGAGKVSELANLLIHHQAKLVIFNHDLSPSQERNLEKRLGVHVISRTALILKIFSDRARTHEGKLQVELAQLQYQATRLVRGWTHLERQRGGIGVRGGPGETQLEIDKRLLRQKIKSIRLELEKVKGQRKLGRALRKRSRIPLIALVGYTNAGKSTLFNRLTGAEVYAANQLFATLDPTLRHFELAQFGEVIFADTVGFIRNLPHQLVDAFRATLEEAVEADLLIHVMDASHSDYLTQKEQVLYVLNEIGAGDQSILEVMNKIDLCEQLEPRLDFNELDKPAKVWVSALTGLGMPLLMEALLKRLSETFFEGEIILAPNQGHIRSTLYEWEAIKSESVDEKGNFNLIIKISQSSLDRLLKTAH